MSSSRYARQTNLAELGQCGQQALLSSHVLVVGCGAVGGHVAQFLARAGVGRLRLADRDFPELHNLPRQILYDEIDVASKRPKALAAQTRLQSINSEIHISAEVGDVSPGTIERLLDGVDLVIDGTDNFETRYVVNDACVKHGIPWIYGGALGTEGMCMLIIPQQGPCLRCVFEQPPAPAITPTCETRGVLNTVPALTAVHQASLAMRWLTGAAPPVTELLRFDPWHGFEQRLQVKRRADCPCCGRGEYPFLHQDNVSWTTHICGSELVQIEPAGDNKIDLAQLLAKLEKHTTAALVDGVLRVDADAYDIFVFADGRAIVRGTRDKNIARRLYAQYIGL